jgi:hypothetical protein
LCYFLYRLGNRIGIKKYQVISSGTSASASHRPFTSSETDPGKLIREFSKSDPRIRVASVVDNRQEAELPSKEMVKLALLAAVSQKLNTFSEEQEEQDSFANSIADILLTLLETNLPPQFNFYFGSVDVTNEVMAVYNQYAKHLTKQ